MHQTIASDHTRRLSYAPKNNNKIMGRWSRRDDFSSCLEKIRKQHLIQYITLMFTPIILSSVIDLASGCSLTGYTVVTSC